MYRVCTEACMIKSLLPTQSNHLLKQRKGIISFAVSLCAAIVGSLLLFNADVTGFLISTIIGIGLDPMRAQLVTFLLVTTGVAFIGALVSRHRIMAMLVAVVTFCIGYLKGFVQLMLQPLRDPGGTLEALNGWALLHTTLMMIALALLCAFIGAAVGLALADAVLLPLLQLGILLWRRMFRSIAYPATPVNAYSESKHAMKKRIYAWLGAGLMLVSLILASGASELFEFSPD